MTRLFLLIVLLVGTATTVAAQVRSHGDWMSLVTLDPIDDSHKALAIVLADLNSDAQWFGMKCLDGYLVLTLGSHNGFQGDADHRVSVTYRFDRDPPVGPERWELADTRQGALLPQERVTDFVRRARRAHTLAVRVEDPGGRIRLTETFSLNGFSAAYDRITPCR